MKQIWPNYSYSPTTNVLTLTGLNIDRDQLLLVTAADRGRIMYNFADSSVTASAFTSGANTALTLVATTAGLTTTAALVIYYDDQLASTTVTVSSLPAISGTVTANTRNNGISNDPWVYIPRLTMSHPDTGNFVFDGYYRFNGENQWGSPNFNSGNCAYLTRFVQSDNYFFNLMVHDDSNDQEITFAQWDSGQTTDFPTSMVAISGTLVSGSLTFNTEQRESYGVRVANSVTIGNTVTIAGTVTANPTGTQTIAGSVTLGAGTAQIGSVTASISNSVTIASLPAISGTVTANSSNGSLTTRFGSVTTANTAFATSAVTNASRKYLLIQNITTASNVITVGVGFIPTTTQGIQLSSGAGLTFEGSYIPTGAVNLLSSVTASCFTILEA